MKFSVNSNKMIRKVNLRAIGIVWLLYVIAFACSPQSKKRNTKLPTFPEKDNQESIFDEETNEQDKDFIEDILNNPVDDSNSYYEDYQDYEDFDTEEEYENIIGFGYNDTDDTTSTDNAYEDEDEDLEDVESDLFDEDELESLYADDEDEEVTEEDEFDYFSEEESEDQVIVPATDLDLSDAEKEKVLAQYPPSEKKKKGPNYLLGATGFALTGGTIACIFAAARNKNVCVDFIQNASKRIKGALGNSEMTTDIIKAALKNQPDGINDFFKTLIVRNKNAIKNFRQIQDLSPNDVKKAIEGTDIFTQQMIALNAKNLDLETVRKLQATGKYELITAMLTNRHVLKNDDMVNELVQNSNGLKNFANVNKARWQKAIQDAADKGKSEADAGFFYPLDPLREMVAYGLGDLKLANQLGF